MPTVNDFFCGAGGMGLGFKNAGFDIKGAWDFDKYAVQSYAENVGNHVKQMSILDMVGSDVPHADVWTFGFPCQDLSIAGKQAGLFEGKRSGLFFEVMRLLGEVDKLPKVILAENVKGLKPYLPVLKEEYAKAGYVMYCKLFNSKYWGVPQNRERYFVVGIRKDLDKGLFRYPTQKEDFVPKLSSILEENVDEKFYISDEKAAKIIEQAGKRNPIEKHTDRMEKLGGIWGNKQAGSCFNKNGISPTLKTPSGGYSEPLILTVGNTNPSGNGMNGNVYHEEGISPTLTTNKGEGIKTVVYNRKDGIKKETDISPTLSASDWRGLNQNQSKAAVVSDFRVRKLTPREYARLQGFPDSYKQVVSNSQFYKQMGNAVTVNVAEAIANAIKEVL